MVKLEGGDGYGPSDDSDAVDEDGYVESDCEFEWEPGPVGDEAY